MITIGLFTLITAVALPNININSLSLLRITSLTLICARVRSINGLYINSIGSGIGIFSGLFEVTSITQSIDILIFRVGRIIIAGWAPVNKFLLSNIKTFLTALPTIPEYSLIVLFTTCGASFLMSSSDLISMYLSIELQSFAVYILAALYRDSESATSAGLKYFLLGGLSSGLILLGSALIYAYTGLTNFENIFRLLSVDGLNNMTEGLGPCIIGLTIMIIGFLFKVAAAPFHNWAPDVYDGTPTIVTTWLTIMPKISIFVFLLELQSGLNGQSLILSLEGISFDVWKNLLLTSALLSLIIGTVVGLAQYRIKRLFAYSTISHVGFLLLALGINSEESIESFLFYLRQYTITNLDAFLIVLAFGYVMNTYVLKNTTDIKYISDLKGQFRQNPLLGLALTICLFSIAGVPPLIGFFGKQSVLYASTHRGLYFLSFVAIIVSVISASYYLKIIRVIHFEPYDKNNEEMKSEESTIKLTNVHSFAIATLTMIIALYALYPTIFINSTRLLALTLFNI